MNPEKLKSLQDQVRIGGKGTARRKKKVVHKTSSSDDKKLQNHLKKMGMNSIPGIEEVNMFQDDGNVLHFNNPKALAELLPNVLSQLDPQSLSGLKKLFSSPAAKNGSIPEAANEQEDVPELTGDFETVAESS